jgi:ABC-type transport system involved in Fe-S cluster assembly fused permease/ATPase subunit
MKIKRVRVLLLYNICNYLATSGLEIESEKIVQENRTSITTAHRLSTIQDADIICVLHNGVIVESSTHQKWLALDDLYYCSTIEKLKSKMILM